MWWAALDRRRSLPCDLASVQGVVGVKFEEAFMKKLLAAMMVLLLAGCVTTDDSVRGRPADPVRDADYYKYSSEVGKTFWVEKYTPISVVRQKSYPFPEDEIAKIDVDSGPVKFERLDVFSKNFYYYYVTWSGGSGWVDAARLYRVVLRDKPRIEKRVGGPVKVGMTKQQVIDSSLGLPDSVKSWTGKGYIIEHWSYGGKDDEVIFFENGIVTVIKRN